MKGKLFSKPAGDSEHTWNNMHMGTTGSVTCEACGTEHPELDPHDSSRILDRLFGLTIVEECCGAAIDRLYAELGEEFFEQFLKEYADDPLATRFIFTGRHINEALDKANKKALELAVSSSTVRAATR